MVENTQNAPPGDTFDPIAPDQRIDSLDILRGFALFGVLWMNLPERGGGAIDRIFDQIGSLLALGKFVTIFGFLFGVGFSLQWMRSTRHGRKPTVHALRRLVVLFLIGVLHYVFVWDGDILTTYALMGVYLLVIHSLPLSQRTILAVAVCLLAVVTVRGEVALTQRITRELGVTTHWDITGTALRERRERRAEAELQSYTRTSYRQNVERRGEELRDWLGSLDAYLPNKEFVFFLLGLWATRAGIFHDVDRHRRLLRRILWWGFPLGVMLWFGGFVSSRLLYAGHNTWLVDSVFRGAEAIGRPVLGITYVATIALLLRHEGWVRRLRPLRYVGRMALTNYLMQSLAFTLVASSYGLGIYTKLAGVTVLLYTLIFFAAQILVSRWWLARFRFGPAEWAWRSLTYGALMPWRI
jgi:uncharacterized protein